MVASSSQMRPTAYVVAPTTADAGRVVVFSVFVVTVVCAPAAVTATANRSSCWIRLIVAQCYSNLIFAFFPDFHQLLSCRREQQKPVSGIILVFVILGLDRRVTHRPGLVVHLLVRDVFSSHCGYWLAVVGFARLLLLLFAHCLFRTAGGG
jgi:hypothetical protein